MHYITYINIIITMAMKTFYTTAVMGAYRMRNYKMNE